MSETARAIVSGVFASVAFLAAYFALTHPPSLPTGHVIVSVVLALGVYVGVFLVLPRRTTLADRLRLALSDGSVAPEEVADMLLAARERIAALRDAGTRLSADLQARVLSLADLADRIVGLLEAEPADFRRVGRLLRRDLTAASEIADRYARLDTAVLDPDRAAEVTRRFQAALSDFERVLQKHQARTYDNELFDLEVRLQMVEQQDRSG